MDNATTLHTQTYTISDSDIVPENEQNRLLYWRDKFKVGCFDIGDIACELVVRAAESGFRVTQSQVFDAIGRFCGKSGRTIRYYYETSIFFPQEVRDDYEELPFSHFVFARSMGHRWEEVLEYAQSKPHITLAGLEHMFVGARGSSCSGSVVCAENDDSCTSTQNEQESSITSTYESVLSTSDSNTHRFPESPRVRVNAVISHLSTVIEKVSYLIDDLPDVRESVYFEKHDMEDKMRTLRTCLDSIRELLPDIVRYANED
jgi:hypothetical protein